MFIRLLLSTGNVVLSLILGAVGLAMMGIHYPETLIMLSGWAAEFKHFVIGLGIEPRYNVWIDLLLEQKQVLFMGFTIAARIVLSLLTGLLFMLIPGLRGV